MERIQKIELKQMVKKPKKIVPVKKVKKRIKKRKSLNFLNKSKHNPIIEPIKENGWESWQTFNPGVIQIDNKVYFIYRAIGEDGVSRFGFAVSNDGFVIEDRLPYPIYEHKTNESKFYYYSYLSGGSFGGCEDPRLVQIEGEDELYISYTACDNGLRMALNSIKIDDFENQKWKWKESKLISPPQEVHKNWLIFPEKINGKYALLHSIKPDIQIEYMEDLEFNNDSFIESIYKAGPQKGCWEKWVRGAGPPPIKTKDGWLLFYHAMDDDFSKYKLGVMLLDLKDPTKVLYRAKEPILEPNETYENCGYKSGVIYASGTIVKDGNLLVYYGGADSYVCVAYAPLGKFLKALKENSHPVLKTKKLRTKK
ncbi:hypothetical protein ACFL3C_00795 [Patescibacteria group bacterium]